MGSHPSSVDYVRNSGDEDMLINTVVEVTGAGRFEVRQVP